VPDTTTAEPVGVPPAQATPAARERARAWLHRLLEHGEQASSGGARPGPADGLATPTAADSKGEEQGP
jgi:hypothetical protein